MLPSWGSTGPGARAAAGAARLSGAGPPPPLHQARPPLPRVPTQSSAPLWGWKLHEARSHGPMPAMPLCPSGRHTIGP